MRAASSTWETADGDQLLATADHDTLSVWRLPEGRRLFARTLSPNFIGVAWSPDASHLLLTDESGVGELIGGQSGERLGRFELVDEDGAGRAFYGVWDRSGKHLTLSGDEAYSQSLPPMQIRDGRNGALRWQLDLSGAANPRWLDDARLLLWNQRGLVAIANVTRKRTEVLRSDAGGPLGAHQAWGAVSHDRRHFALSPGDGRLELWDLERSSRRQLVAPASADETMEWLGAPLFSPDDTQIALTRGRAILLVDVAQTKPTRRVSLTAGEQPQSVYGTWSSTGRLVVRRGGATVSYDALGRERSRLALPDDHLLLPRDGVPDKPIWFVWGDGHAGLLRIDDGARLEIQIQDGAGGIDVAYKDVPSERDLAAFFAGMD